jgi:hypothetical protein
MNCENHEDREAAGTCVGCGRPFCDECMMDVGKKKYCEDCAKEELKKKTEEEKDQKKQNITVTQQTTTQQDQSSDKPKGSVLVLCIWIILFWPVAILYYFMRRWD